MPYQTVFVLCPLKIFWSRTAYDLDLFSHISYNSGRSLVDNAWARCALTRFPSGECLSQFLSAMTSRLMQRALCYARLRAHALRVTCSDDAVSSWLACTDNSVAKLVLDGVLSLRPMGSATGEGGQGGHGPLPQFLSKINEFLKFTINFLIILTLWPPPQFYTRGGLYALSRQTLRWHHTPLVFPFLFCVELEATRVLHLAMSPSEQVAHHLRFRLRWGGGAGGGSCACRR